MNKKEKANIVEEIKNDIQSRDLDQFYGRSSARNIRESYGFYRKNNMENLATYLRETGVLKYIRLSNALRQLASCYQEDLEKAIVLLKHENYKGEMTDQEIKTTYKEFKKIERTSRKIKINKAIKLNKSKELKYFVKYDYNIVLGKLLNQKINVENKEELISFFDSCEELAFLNDEKVIKKIK